MLLAVVVPRLRADGLHRLRVVPAVMWEVVKVGGHLVQRTGFLLATLAVATAVASRVGTAHARRAPDRRPAVHLPGHRRRHVQGAGPVAGRPRARGGPSPTRPATSSRTCTAGPRGPALLPDGRDAPRRPRSCRWRSAADPPCVDEATIALLFLAAHPAPGRADLRARRRAHGRQRLPRPALADHAGVRRLPAGLRGGVARTRPRHRRRVDGDARVDLRPGR